MNQLILPSPKTSRRVEWLDYAKFIGIFLVILGHQDLPASVYNFIYTFHMPLFFFISGYLFSFQKYQSGRKFVRHRARQLLIPYFALGLVTYLYWVLILQQFGAYKDEIPSWKPLVGMFYGVSEGGYLGHCIPSWFLPCLFCVEVIFYFAFRDNKHRAFTLLGLVVVGYLMHWMPVRLPFGLDVACAAIFFYALGHYLKPYVQNWLVQKPGLLLAAVLGLLALTLLFSGTNQVVDMRVLVWGNWYALFLLGGVSGTLLVITVGRLLAQALGRRAVVERIASNTLIILFFQQITKMMLRVVGTRVLSIPDWVFNTPTAYTLVCAVLILVLHIPLIWLINRYAPFLLGRGEGLVWPGAPKVVPLKPASVQ